MTANESPNPTPDPAEPPEIRALQKPDPPRKGRRASLGRMLGGLARQLQTAGRDAVSVALGRVQSSEDEESSAENPGVAAEEGAKAEKTSWRVNMLHAATEKLRGAANTYIAAKLDEIEARVDEKLDSIEQRIDTKIVEIHEQVREMRDRELRHRLRLLKITLIFTVLVALLSLGYKFVAKYLIG